MKTFETNNLECNGIFVGWRSSRALEESSRKSFVKFIVNNQLEESREQKSSTEAKVKFRLLFQDL